MEEEEEKKDDSFEFHSLLRVDSYKIMLDSDQ
jgi:hypothetical protein